MRRRSSPGEERLSAMPIDASQRAAAKTVGIVYPITFALVVWVNFGVVGRLIDRADPEQTVRNIVAHESLFRLGVTGNLLYGLGVFVLSAALYVILKPVSPPLALLAAGGRAIHGFTWLLVSLNLFTALRLVKDPGFARVLGDQLPALSRLYLSGFDAYYVGLAFWSLGATVGACLWLRSGYVPRALAAFGIVASAWCAACTFALFLFPEFPKVVNLWLFDTPMALFELTLSIVLFVRGLKRPAAAVAAPGAEGARSDSRSRQPFE
jgi:hypothetical protein